MKNKKTISPYIGRIKYKTAKARDIHIMFERGDRVVLEFSEGFYAVIMHSFKNAKRNIDGSFARTSDNKPIYFYLFMLAGGNGFIDNVDSEKEFSYYIQ